MGSLPRVSSSYDACFAVRCHIATAASSIVVQSSGPVGGQKQQNVTEQLYEMSNTSLETLLQQMAAEHAGDKPSAEVITFVSDATLGMRVDQLRPSGSSARKTHLSDSDMDIVLYFRDKPPSFADAKKALKQKVEQVESALKSYGRWIGKSFSFMYSSHHVVHCVIEGMDVDVVCTWSISDEEWERTPANERKYFSAARSFVWTEIMKKQPTEVNEVARLMKYFGKNAFATCKDGRPHPLSCVMEAVVLEAKKRDTKQQDAPRTWLLQESLRQTVQMCSAKKLASPIDKAQNLLTDWKDSHLKELRAQAVALLQRTKVRDASWTAASLWGPPPLNIADKVAFYVDVDERHHKKILADVDVLRQISPRWDFAITLLFVPQQRERKTGGYVTSTTPGRGAAAAQLTRKLLADASDPQKRRGDVLVIVHDGQGAGLHQELAVMGEEAAANARRSGYNYGYQETESTPARVLTWDIRHGPLGRLFQGMCAFGCGKATDEHMRVHKCPCCGEEPVWLEMHKVYRCTTCTRETDRLMETDTELIYCDKSKSKHEEDQHASCSECKKVFSHQNRHLSHTSIPLDTPFNCCYAFTRDRIANTCAPCMENLLARHSRIKHPRCPLCLEYIRHQTSPEHLKHHHPKVFRECFPFRCGGCHESFPNKAAKKKHKKTCNAVPA